MTADAYHADEADGTNGGPTARRRWRAAGLIAVSLALLVAAVVFGPVVAGATMAALAAGALAIWWLRGARGAADPSTAETGLRGRPALIAAVAAGLIVWVGATTAVIASLPAVAGGSDEGRLAALEARFEALMTELAAAPPDQGASAALPAADPAIEPVAPLALTDPVEVPAATVAEPEPVIEQAAGAPPAATATPVAATVGSSGARVASGPNDGPLDTAGRNLYNCRDFTSWEQAVAVFRASGPGDPNSIDTDRNGIPCEDLKANELAAGR